MYERRAGQLESAAKEKDTPENQKKLAEARSKAGDAYIAWSRDLVMSDDKGYGQSMWKGIGMYEAAGDLPRMIAALETFTAQRPDDSVAPEAWFRLGQAYRAVGQFDKAIETYRRLQALYTRSLPASKSGVPIALAYIAKGPDFYAKAEQTLKSVIYDNPQITPEASEFRDALSELARLYHQTGRYEQAIAQLEEVTQRYPNDERLGHMYFLMADSYRKSAAMLDARLTAAAGIAGTTRPSFNMEEAMAERKNRLERSGRAFKDGGGHLQGVRGENGDRQTVRKAGVFLPGRLRVRPESVRRGDQAL